MKISVIITNYNYAAYLPQAIESALNQVDCDQEIIIVDDGSTDDSPRIAETYVERDSRVRCIRKTNSGQGSAFNAGVAAARGDVLAFLDADDYWYPNKLKMVQALHHDWGMVQHNLLINGKLPFLFLKQGAHARKNLFLYGHAGIIPTSGISISRWVAEKIFPIPEDGTEICADLYIKYTGLIHSEMWSLNDYLGFYRVHANNHWYNSGKVGIQERIIESVNLYALSIGEKTIPVSDSCVSDAWSNDIKLPENSSYFIYGAGTIGKYMHVNKNFTAHRFLGFIDSKSDLWGTYINDFQVFSPETLRQYLNTDTKIIIASMYAAEILQTLEAMGFREGEQVIVPRI